MLADALSACVDVEAIGRAAVALFANRRPRFLPIHGLAHWRTGQSRRLANRNRWPALRAPASNASLAFFERLDDTPGGEVRLSPAVLEGCKVKSWRLSMLEEIHTKRIIRVGIYPALEAPNAAQILSGRTLADICVGLVWNDPEAVLARKKAGSRDLDITPETKWMLAEDREGQNGPAEARTDVPSSIIRRRLDRLVQLLSERRGYLRRADGERLEWDKLFLPGAFIAPLTGAVTTPASLADEKAVVHHDLVFGDPSDGNGPTIATSTSGTSKAERECRKWLEDVMKKSPVQRTQSKDDWWEFAKELWGKRLTRRAFDRAWGWAIGTTGAVAWKQPGRLPDTVG